MTRQQEWWDWVRPREDGAKQLPHRVPARPSVVYRNSGWIDYDDWLGASAADADNEGDDAAARAGTSTTGVATGADACADTHADTGTDVDADTDADTGGDGG